MTGNDRGCSLSGRCINYAVKLVVGGVKSTCPQVATAGEDVVLASLQLIVAGVANDDDLATVHLPALELHEQGESRMRGPHERYHGMPPGCQCTLYDIII
jgi:hypothetical protein